MTAGTAKRTMTSEVDFVATCRGCAWRTTARNALGIAARHHDATDHVVDVVITRDVVYGDPRARGAGQLSITDELELDALEENPAA